LAVWALLLAALVCGAGVRATVAGIPFQLCVISAGIVTLLPAAVALPGYHASLTFVAQRMSLAVAICVCAMLATACPRAFERYAVVAVAAVFFGFIYRDERMLNGLEDRMERALAGLQPGARVVSGIEDTSLHTVAVNHMIDRLCVGRCFSYANYEPSTGAFRVRATGVNSLVMAEYGDCWKLQMGRYVVKASDPPLTELVMDSAGRFSLRNLKAGMPCGSTSMKALTG